MITCTRRLEFDAAHRIPRHVAKCKLVHGHRYVIEATFAITESDKQKLNDMGMVVDFGIIKERLGGWINDNWDHNIILSAEDSALGKSIQQYTKQRVFYMDVYPTAENLAYYLLNEVCPKLFNNEPTNHIKCISIRIYETPNSYAEAKLQP